MAYESHADVIGFGGAAGGGKGLALDTRLPTPTGWVSMAEVRVGDTVFDDAGKPCTVTAVSEVSHRPCYRLTFDDGSVLVADDVHRWVTFDAAELSALTRRSPEWREKRRAARTSRAKPGTSAKRLAALAAHNAVLGARAALSVPAGAMRDTLTLHASLSTPQGRANHAIAVCGALQAPEAALPIAPYTLGAWLGDGSSRNAQITGVDASVWDRIEQDGFTVRHYAHSDQAHNILGLKPLLRELGVAENKHIPLAYLRASVEQRLALLQGIMDTDGHAALDGGCEFDNTSERLARDVFSLVLSLGVKATLQQGTAKLNGRVIGPKWRVKFVTTLPVFAMPRKAERMKGRIRRTARFRYLVSCEPVESVPTRCIAVDSPTRQYLAGEAMIPTHNTDLACGKALTQHQVVQIFRREGTELTAIVDRMEQILGTRDGLGGKPPVWRTPTPRCRLIEFGSVPNLGDEKKYQGRAKDLLVIDEAANFLESQVRFLMGWVRTTDPNQRCQTLLTFNPPTSAEGRWIVEFFGPWLDDKHPNPAAPGELRWFATIDGAEVEVADGTPFERNGETILPQSRTFIPSRVTDNPHLVGTNYMATLQALPEPLRSQMLYGDFKAGMEDDPWQVIPTAWVDAAMARWKPLLPVPEMDSMGVDVARGGKDNTVIARRHGMWFDEPLVCPGTETPNGPMVAGLVISAKRNGAPIHIDVIGVGASPYDFLVEAKQQVMGVNVSEKAPGLDKSGRLTFANLRSQLWWAMREALDPEANTGIALPPDKRLRADLCAPKWAPVGARIQVESREQIIDRIGRSPDWASAYLLALMDTPKLAAVQALNAQHKRTRPYDPYQGLAG